MKRLVYITGKINSPFFTNEIDYFCKIFDKIHVITYNDDNISLCNHLASKYGFTYQRINQSLKKITVLYELIFWKKREHVKEEIKTIMLSKRNRLKKLIYMYMYGIYAIAIEKIVNEYIKLSDDEIYLYSFWLSRAAFAIASMNLDRNSHVVRIVSRTHRYDLYEEENQISYLPFRKFISENLDVIYFASKNTYEYYKLKRYSNLSSQAALKLSYLGTRSTKYKKINTNENKIVIASCAYISQRKRLDLIIKIISYISDFWYNIKWIHIGNGELEDEIKSMASRLLKSDKIEYVFTGKLPDEEIYALYNRENVDFFINMSDSEGIPVSLLEALSMAIPSIARNVGGNSEAIIDSYNGILIPKTAVTDEDLRELAQRIVLSFDNTNEYLKLSQNAYTHWERFFNADYNATQICKDIVTLSEIAQML